MNRIAQCEVQGCMRTASAWVRKVTSGIGARTMHVCLACANEMTALFGWVRR